MSEEDRKVIIGEKLPDKLNKTNILKEISPENFSPSPSYPKHFRDDMPFLTEFIYKDPNYKKIRLSH